ARDRLLDKSARRRHTCGVPRSQVLVILLTDIRNFTDRTAKSTRSGIFRLIEKHKELVLPILQRRGGTLVKTIGDAFLVIFHSPTDAVLAGVEVQDALGRFNASVPDDQRIEVRIAINMGEVNVTDNDIYGEPVNVTSRIATVAEAGEVFFTESVYLNMNKAEVPSSEVGWLQLKGISEKVRVYKVKRERPVGGDAPPRLLEERGAKAWAADPAPKKQNRWFVPAFVAIALAIIAVPNYRKKRAEQARAQAEQAAHAQTARHAFHEPERAGLRACDADVKRLCADVEPGGGRLLR